MVCAADGPEALRLLRTVKPRLVLLDYGMPGMDGLEVPAAIRNDARSAAVAVPMFSAHDGAARERALAAGVDPASHGWAYSHPRAVGTAGRAPPGVTGRSARPTPAADDAGGGRTRQFIAASRTEASDSCGSKSSALR